MKAWIFFICLLFVIPGSPASRESEILEGVFRPSVIDVRDHKLFVMDIEKMHIFSLHPLKHLHTFGKKGEGPGEYPVLSSTSNSIRVTSDFLFHEALNKILLFDLEGRFLREQKKPPLIKDIHSLGSRWVGRRIFLPRDGATAYSAIQIYDRNLKMVKEIARQVFFQQGTGAALTFDLGYDMLIFDVAGNRIFVDRSREGPFIDVFDTEGRELYRISLPWEKSPVTSRDRKKLLNYLIQDPRMQQIMRRNHIRWKTLSRDFRFRYPDCYPPICDMCVDDGQIYVKTWQRDSRGRDQYWIMNLRGHRMRKAFIPVLIPFQTRFIGREKLETIHRGIIYYLTENDEGDWFLHTRKINR